MSANISERLGLSNQERYLKIGDSFLKNSSKFYHTFRYDFKPKSVDAEKMATVDIGQGNQVTVTVPHVDKGTGATHTVFKGSKKLYQKECVLIIDNKTGEITLEKLSHNVQLKKTRAEGSSKIKQHILENSLGNNLGNNLGTKKLGNGKAAQHGKLWSQSSYSIPKCSPLPRSPNSQSSPPARISPSVPSVVPAVSKHSSPTTQNAAIPAMSKDDDDVDMDVPQIGVLSSSESSSSCSASDSDSSSEESVASNVQHGRSKVLNGIQRPKAVKSYSPPSTNIAPGLKGTSQNQFPSGNLRSKLVKPRSPPTSNGVTRSMAPQPSLSNGTRCTSKLPFSSNSVGRNTSDADQLNVTNGKLKSSKIVKAHGPPQLSVAASISAVDQLHRDLELSDSDSD